MKKTILIILVLLCVNVVGILLLPQTSPIQKRQTISIAVAVPMTGVDRKRGREILNSIRLYLDQVKSSGILQDKKIELIIHDDRQDRRTALKIASQLISENKALLILGHYYSSSAVIAGSLYQQRGIPAITASATSDAVTSENNWYFSVIPNNRFISGYIAEYIHRGLGYSSATLIYDSDSYGDSLAKSFIKKARELNIKVKGRFSFDREDSRLNERISYITAQLRAMDDPGIIYCATHPTEGVKILAGLKFPGAPYTVVGPDSFSSPSFIEEMKSYPKERNIPGYYSEGVYSVSPFLESMAGEKGRRFRDAYFKAYNSEPSWLAATYYDAIQVAVRAIEYAEIGGDDIQEDRRRVKNAIEGIDSKKTAVSGITGSIYFDQNGNSQKPLAVGIYNNQSISPAFLQFEHLADVGDRRAIKDAISDNIIVVDNKIMAKMRLIDAGIHIIEVRNLDERQNSFDADFLIWFRYQGRFNEKQLRFSDAITPVKMGKPIIEQKQGDITLQAYRVKAHFKSAFDYGSYPFDHQQLTIRFHHRFMTQKRLIFVPDVAGIPGKMTEPYLKGKLGRTLSGWQVNDISVYQDTLKMKKRSSKFAIDFSQFNAAIRIDRGTQGFVVNIFIPMGIMLILLYIAYWLPPDQIRHRAYLIAAVSIINIVYHMKLLSVFSQGHIAVAVLSVYGLAGVAVVMTWGMYLFNRRENVRYERFFMTAGKMIHPALILIVGCWISYLYMS